MTHLGTVLLPNYQTQQLTRPNNTIYSLLLLSQHRLSALFITLKILLLQTACRNLSF